MFLSIVILMTPNYGKRFHSKHKQWRPDQTASPEANCSESAVYWNIVWRSKVKYTTFYWTLQSTINNPSASYISVYRETLKIRSKESWYF